VSVAPGVSAFDDVAASYDASFTDRLPGRWFRASVWERLERTFRPGDHVLELGCGTGEDALWLARRGVRVTATDNSAAMLDVTRRKTAAAGMTGRIAALHLDLATPGEAPWGPGTFSGAFSDFGALNCVGDRGPIAAALASWVRPGGYVALVVMGPCCPWELVWHLLHGDPATALRRFRPGRHGHVGGGGMVRVWYPSPRRLRAELRPWFDHLDTLGIGVLLPPPGAAHVVARWPRFWAGLRGLERRIAARFPFTWLGDHYLAVFRRR
jgi:SAM-dependent methyltransferase